MLSDILTVNATLVSQQQNAEMARVADASYRQNEQVKKISAWAAILFAPTVIGTTYGMNFDHMPELGWLLGHPMALALMATFSAGLWAVFKRRNWIWRLRHNRWPAEGLHTVRGFWVPTPFANDAFASANPRTWQEASAVETRCSCRGR